MTLKQVQGYPQSIALTHGCSQRTHVAILRAQINTQETGLTVPLTPHAAGSSTWSQDLNWETEKEDGGGEGGGGEDTFSYRSQPYVGPAFIVKVCIFIST